MKRSQFLLSLFLGAALFLSACGDNLDEDFEVHASSSGVMAESMIPGDVSMVFAYSNLEEGQVDALEAIRAKLPAIDSFFELLRSSVGELDALGINYEQDIAPILEGGFRLVLAGDASLYASENLDALGPDMYLVFTLPEDQALLAFLDKLVGMGALDAETISGETAYVNEEEAMYMLLTEGNWIIANSPEALTKMLDLSEKDSLWEYEEYRLALEEVGPEHMAYFVQFPALTTEMVQDDPVVSALNLNLTGMLEAVDYQTVAFLLEDDGVRMKTSTQYDKKKMKDLGLDVSDFPQEDSYMYENFPAEGILLYGESYNLASAFDQMLELYGIPEEDLQAIKLGLSFGFGLNLEDDILSFMDEGFAFAMHDNQTGLVPGLSLVFDASSNPEAARNFLTIVDEQLAPLLLLSADSSISIDQDTVQVGGADFTRYSFSFSPSEELGASPLAGFDQAFLDKPLEFMFGVTEDNWMVITNATVWQNSTMSIEETELYERLEDHIDYEQGLVYGDVQNMTDFFLEWMDVLIRPMVLSASPEGALPDDGAEFDVMMAELEFGFNVFENIMGSFEGFMLASEMDGNVVRSEGFLLLAD